MPPHPSLRLKDKHEAPQSSPSPKNESIPPEAKKGGKGGGKGKHGKSESRPEKRKQQCIPFFRGTCQKGHQCKYEHQVDSDGRPVPVGPEILQRYDEAVKRFNKSRAQANQIMVTASMIVLDPEESLQVQNVKLQVQLCQDQ